MSNEHPLKEADAKMLLVLENMGTPVVSEFFYTAAEGIEKATGDQPDALRAGAALQHTMHAVLVLEGGNIAVGHTMYKGDPENWSREKAEAYARSAALENVARSLLEQIRGLDDETEGDDE